MPELAEVEFGRKEAERVALGRVITEVQVADDEIVFAKRPAEQVRALLLGRKVVGTRRHGKYIWFELDARPWPLFHFGMTGAFRVQGKDPLELAASPKTPDRSWPPRFTKIHMTFDDGGQLVMTNARRLGRIRLLEDPRAEPPVSKLGFDPYLEMPSPAAFVARLTRRKVCVKALLLDQGFAAGVGNWLADEILYQARISPHRKTRALDPDAQKRLHQAIRKVVRTAVEADAVADRFPKTWLFHHRWDKVRDRTTGVTTARGESVRFDTVGGRTTAWVPARQR